MAFTVATNISSLNTQRYLNVNQAEQQKALARLSSGYKINSASDDSAGIAIATKLQVKSAALDKSIDNGNQGMAMLQAAEGGIDQISQMLTRLKEIATQSASSNTTDRVALNNERSNLETEINNIAQNTKYGSTTLLGGSQSVSATGTSITVGMGIANIDVANAAVTTSTAVTLAYNQATGVATLSIGATSQTMSVTAPTGMNTSVLNFNNLGVKITINASFTTSLTANNVFTISTGTSSFTYYMGDENQNFNKITASLKNYQTSSTDVLNLKGDISTQAGAQDYLGTLDNAINNLTTERGNLGAAMNQIGYHVANMQSMSQNTKAATSTIKDADFASEMATFTKDQILTQAGVSMLAQANQMNQQILSLLK